MGIELELIVLLSFAIHVFLFFAGRFQMCFSDKFIRSIFGLAYLGANLVAVYALGNLPRQDEAGSTNSIAFLWAPFLLIHLGGNDTITAWTLEDNNLWLRSWCNLVLHVALAGYAFWKSIGRHSVELLVSAIFVFVTGTIKYGERAWCLKASSMESLENSTGRRHYEIELPENSDESQAPNNPTYSDTICEALCSMCEVHDIFAAHKLSTSSEDEYAVVREMAQYDSDLDRFAFPDTTTQPTESGDDANARDEDAAEHILQISGDGGEDEDDGGEDEDQDDAGEDEDEDEDEDGGGEDEYEVLKACKLVELQLGMMHDDLYSKALILRTRTGLALRFMSVISACVAFGLFIASDKQRYSRADIAISYSLFIGLFFLEFCSMVILMMSPWTWAWFKSQGLSMPAKISWFLLSSRIGWPEARPRWSTSMGQCNIMHMLVGMYKTRSLTPKAMVHCRTLLNVFGFGKEPISWLSNLIHTEYVTVDERVMDHVMEGLHSLSGELTRAALALEVERRRRGLLSADELSVAVGLDVVARWWPHLRKFLLMIQEVFIEDFGTALLMLHMVTDVCVSQYPGPMTQQEHGLVDVCTRLSNYMMYLLVNHPSSLPLNTSALFSLEKAKATFSEQINGGGTSEEKYNNIKAALLQGDQPTGEDPLTELIDMWTRVLLYAAGRTKAEHHAAHLVALG
jgi:hypothetical protein